MLVDTETYIDCPYRYWAVAQVPGRRAYGSKLWPTKPRTTVCGVEQVLQLH